MTGRTRLLIFGSVVGVLTLVAFKVFAAETSNSSSIVSSGESTASIKARLDALHSRTEPGSAEEGLQEHVLRDAYWRRIHGR